ncbi:hypothetical protein GCM10009863_46010 [Streptomyces axinellae]|uniref:Fido domain-containing protein n=1 Tax=Streptomyces axinellae TaxID=552788 RepID=A0ABP6CQF2_9ACTN
MTEVRYIQLDETPAIARAVNGTEHSVRDMGLLVSAIERPRTNVFGAELYPTPHEKAAALLHSVARNRALIDGNKRTAWLATRVFLRFNGVSAPSPRRTSPSPVRSSRKSRRTTSMYRPLPSDCRPGYPFPDVRR